ncbi:hypothetical protein [Pantoea cypripedii]|uniref:Chromosome partitioning protein ParA n=1 Tax=Pantoea cypripedii TaxID=55209 RepID=A0A1X1EUS2_PANCY|nr:hypothetical protein [Pantoea cypripedii]MBP2197625.1 uncharacterized coiled-coil DUF342 family protein [Pantoea cypripedii]ORM93515.1 hypothetical protein HA50_09205 [Pantoea cypripedii]
MFGFRKKAPENKGADEQEIDRQAESISEKITTLEQELANNPRAGETQKQLMLEYNRALSLFAKSRRFRQEIDPLFIKIDELRNTIRKSI